MSITSNMTPPREVFPLFCNEAAEGHPQWLAQWHSAGEWQIQAGSYANWWIPRPMPILLHHSTRRWERKLCFPHNLLLLKAIAGPPGTHVREERVIFWLSWRAFLDHLQLWWTSLQFGAPGHIPSLQMPLAIQPDSLLPLALSLEDSSESPFAHSLLIAHNYPSSWSCNKQGKG